jgi:hypothetical protein
MRELNETKLVEWAVKRRVECGISLCSYGDYTEGKLAMIEDVIRRFGLTKQFNEALRKAKWSK